MLIFDELPTTDIITTGHLVQWTNKNSIQRHPKKGGTAVAAFALPFQDDRRLHYDYGEICRVGVYNVGDEVMAWIIRGTFIKEGELLESAGTGALRRHVKKEKRCEPVVAIALEDVDNFQGHTEVQIRVVIV